MPSPTLNVKSSAAGWLSLEVSLNDVIWGGSGLCNGAEEAGEKQEEES